MSKEKAFDEKIERQMVERVANFRDALKDPDKRVGENRATRTVDPDFVAPEPIGEAKFEQKDKQDRWSRTEYRETDSGGHAAITVQDPRDPDDMHCTHVSTYTSDPKDKKRVTGEDDREHHPEKISQLAVEDVDQENSESPKS